MTIKPVHLDPAYENPELVLDAIRSHAPYRNIYDAEGFEQGDFAPCFRAYWTPVQGEIIYPELKPLLHNPIFIEATKQAYNAKVVRPNRLLINFNVPSGPQPAHMDQPSFRGIGSQPSWLSNIMGWSKLFRPWEAQISSGLAWFYRGEGGEFRYWPDGPDAPPRAETGPFWNRGIICDNEYTFHQACHTGRREDFLPKGTTGLHCTLDWSGDKWNVMDEGKAVRSYDFDQVRILTLWKAYVFEDERAEQVFDQHTDDLDYGKITRIFTEDLRKRGYTFDEPSDPLNDPVWKRLLLEAYPPHDLPPGVEPVD